MISRPDERYRPLPIGQARLLALLIAIVVVATVCAAATWPRWHPGPPNTSVTPQSSVSVLGAASGTPPVTGAAATRAASNGSGASFDAPAAPVTLPSHAQGAGVVASSAPNPGPVPHTVSAGPAVPPAPLAAGPIPDNPPTWNRLNDAQHTALGPFAAQWDKFSDQQKRKWLAIAAVFPRMSPAAQQRLHARMLRWTQMTPEERMLARENYELSRVLPPSARQQAWLAYEALPPAQKAKLAAAEKLHRRRLVVSALPNSHVDPHARRGAQKAGGHDIPHALTLEPLIPLGTPGAATSRAAPGTIGVAPATSGNSASPQREASASIGKQPRPETAGDAKP